MEYFSEPAPGVQVPSDVNLDPPYLINVAETADVNRLFTFVTFGVNENNELYQFELTDLLDGYFFLDDNTVFLGRQLDLDREVATSQFVLPIMCKYSSDYGISFEDHEEFSLNIQVIPQNDNEPLFTASQYDISLPENKEPSAVNAVLTFTVTDQDFVTDHQISTLEFSGPNKDLAESLFSLSTLATLDNLSLEGHMYLVGYLDYETNQVIQFNIDAINTVAGFGGDMQSSSVPVEVSVVDTDDLDPVFTQLIYYGSVDENYIGQIETTPTLSASDGDAFDEALAYRLAEEISGFSIDSSTGVISVDSPLDRDGPDGVHSVMLQVEAFQVRNTQRKAKVPVQVLVQDVDDNSPVIDQPGYSAEVSENSPNGTIVLTVEASDLDSGTNADFFFEIGFMISEPEFFPFALSHSGTVFVDDSQALDREVQSAVEFTVVAKSVQNPDVTSSSTNVEIRITDQNDNSPVFTQTEYIFTLAENSPTPSTAGTLMATDADEGVNGEVSYVITFFSEGSDHLFEMNGSNLDLIQPIPPSFSANFFSLVITASDNPVNSAPRSTSAEVRVNIQRVNDNSPQFVSNSYQFSIQENSPPDTFVGTVVAFDLDGDSLLYSLDPVDDDDEDVFILINFENEATIRVNRILDRESKDTHSLRVYVTDDGSEDFETSTLVTITVLDQNDHAPLFDQSQYSFSVSEGQPMGVIVGSVSASDQDASLNGEVLYSFVGSSSSFSIDSENGTISTLQALDRELTQEFTLFAKARDQSPTTPLVSIVEIQITVNDINDNAPVFSRSEYTFSFPENYAADSAFKLTAFDSDVGDNAVIEYSLLFDDDNNFLANHLSINSETGEVDITQPFDREQIESVTFKATAGNAAPFSDVTTISNGETNVLLNIQDINDETPEFLGNTPEEIFVPDDKYYGSEIIQFNAFDPDSSPVIYYKIVSGSRGKFYIDQETGVLYTWGHLVAGSSYTLTISAFNPDNPILSTETSLHLLVTASSGEGMQFQGLPYMVYLPLASTVGSEVMTVQLKETTETIEVIFELIGNQYPGIFTINPTTGQISLDGSLSTLNSEELTLVAQVTDVSDKNPPIKTDIDLIVFDEPNEAPVFVKEEYMVTLPDTTQSGHFVVQVFALDDDPGNFGQIMYRIEEDELDLFDIDASEGLITVAPNISISFQPGFNYTFIVAAIDQGRPPKESLVTVSVSVLSTSDTKVPWFDPVLVQASVYENASVGDVIERVVAKSETATDLFSYSIVSTNGAETSQGLFSLDSETGEIKVAQDLDFETVPTEFRLLVSAAFRPSLPDSLIAYGTVIINILDVNDNPPRFENSKYSFQVAENYIGLIGNIQATDSDSGENAIIRYSLSNEINFSVDEQTGNLFVVEPYDSENMIPLKFSIVAEASNISPLVTANLQDMRNEAKVFVDIEVIDVNDNPPIFVDAPQSPVVVHWDLKPGAQILQVSATDDDQGLNSDVTFEVVYDTAESVYFVISSTLDSSSSTGSLSLVTSLPILEIGQQLNWNVEIEARDAGSPSLKSFLVIPLVIVHPEFERPVFQHQSSGDNTSSFDPVTLVENYDLDTYVTTVKAFDNVGEELRYFIIAGNEAGVFHLDAISGIMTLVKSVDKEELQANSEGQLILTIQANRMSEIEKWTDSVDNISVLPQGSYILYNEVVCKHSQLSGDPLCENEEFVVMVQYPENEETTENDQSRRRRSFDESNDPSQDATTAALPSNILELLIVIEDSNDNIPQFPQHEYNFMILMNTPAGTEVTRIQATDADSDDSLTYSIKEVSPQKAFNWFEVDPGTGAISTSNTFFNNFAQQFSLKLQVSDGYHTSFTIVKVVVASNEEVLFWELNVNLSTLQAVSEGLRQFIQEETDLNVKICSLGRSANKDKSLNFEKSFISFYAFNGSYFVFPRQIDRLLPTNESLGELLQSRVPGMELQSSVNVTSFYFKLEEESLFWWIRLEGIGIVYVSFACALLICHFLLFPWILLTNPASFERVFQSEEKFEEGLKNISKNVSDSKPLTNGVNLGGNFKVTRRKGSATVPRISPAENSSNGFSSQKNSWKNLHTPGIRARSKMLESMGYEPPTKEPEVATSSSSKDSAQTKYSGKELNGKASTVTAATREDTFPKLDAESIAEQILKRAKMADYQTHL